MIEFADEIKAKLFDICAECCVEGYHAGVPDNLCYDACENCKGLGYILYY